MRGFGGLLTMFYLSKVVQRWTMKHGGNPHSGYVWTVSKHYFFMKYILIVFLLFSYSLGYSQNENFNIIPMMSITNISPIVINKTIKIMINTMIAPSAIKKPSFFSERDFIFFTYIVIPITSTIIPIITQATLAINRY